jgi:hypothetical protein
MAARRYAVLTGGILGVALVAYLYWLCVRRWRLRSMAISAFTSLNETGIPYWVDLAHFWGYIVRETSFLVTTTWTSASWNPVRRTCDGWVSM